MSAHDNLSTGATGQFPSDSLTGRTGDPAPAKSLDVNDPAATGYLTNHSVAELGQATKDSKAAIDGKH